jgi:WD40 repeat protein
MKIRTVFLLFAFYCTALAGHSQTSYTVLSGHAGAVNRIVLTNDGKKLLSGSKDETIRVWDLQSNAIEKTINTPGSSVKNISVSPDGQKFIAGLYCSVAEYDLKTFKKKKSKNIHTSFVETCLYSSDGKYILTSSWRDKTIVILKSANLKKFIEMDELIWVDNAIFNKAGTKVYSGGHDNLVKVWDVSTGGLIRSLAGHDDWVYDICLSADEKMLFSASFDKTIRYWDLETGKNVFTLKGHTDGIVCIDISNDGKYLATGSSDKDIVIWDIQEKKEIKRLKGHEEAVTDVHFGPDNKRLYSCSIDKTIRIWDLSGN